MTEQFKLAVQVARRLGMTRTWPNLKTIEIAIEGEADFSGVSIEEAADVIVKAANELSRNREDQIFLPSSVLLKENTVDRFWFEDARWRTKRAYFEFYDRLRQRELDRAAGEMTA